MVIKMKKIFFAIFLIIILTVILVPKNLYTKADITSNPNPSYLMDYPEYKNLTLNNIKSLRIIRFTEGGVNEKKVEDKVQIGKIYNFLKQIKILSLSNMSCTDNTTIYSFILNDGSKASIEIECDWIVIKGKNYNFTTSSVR